MKKIAVIDEKRCDKSPHCPVKKVCPRDAIVSHKSKEGFSLFASIEKYEIDPEKCTGCGVCLKFCPMKAVSLKTV